MSSLVQKNSHNDLIVIQYFGPLIDNSPPLVLHAWCCLAIHIRHVHTLISQLEPAYPVRVRPCCLVRPSMDRSPAAPWWRSDRRRLAWWWRWCSRAPEPPAISSSFFACMVSLARLGFWCVCVQSLLILGSRPATFDDRSNQTGFISVWWPAS